MISLTPRARGQTIGRMIQTGLLVAVGVLVVVTFIFAADTIRQTRAILRKQGALMSALDDLTAQVAANTNLEASAAQAINGIAQQLAAVEQQLASAGADTTQLAALTAQLKASAAPLAAAITANTGAAAPPAAPAPGTPPTAA